MDAQTVYQAWHRALAETLHAPKLANQPAYLDIEDDVLVSSASRIASGWAAQH